MGDSGCSGTNCEEDGSTASQMLTVYFNVWGILAFGGLFYVLPDCDRPGRARSDAIQTFVSILCLGGAWPLVACFPCMICWKEWSERERRQRVARRRRLLERYPESRKWRAQGWLIMMRARHQKLLPNREVRMARWSRHRGRTRKLALFDEAAIVKVIKAEAKPDPSDGDLEAGKSERRKFVRAVVTVVKMEEEGLFRHVTAFL